MYRSSFPAFGICRPLLVWCLCCVIFSSLVQCKNETSLVLPPGDPDNGGLILPGNFQAVVVADSTRPCQAPYRKYQWRYICKAGTIMM